jgi:hypothetical protein
MLIGAKREVSAEMSRSFGGFRKRSKDALEYLIALFVFVPGVLLILGLVSHVSLGLVGGLLTIYYLVAILAVTAQGAGWLDRHL